MRFKTRHPDGDNYDGIVIDIKPSLVVISEVDDFELDGTIVLPKRSVKGFRDGEYEKCCNEILRANGQLKKLRPIRWLAASKTIPEALQLIRRRGVWPGIETLPKQEDEWAFYIGPITSLEKNTFSIMNYDATGRWECEYQLKYDEVFRIEFDSKYCNHFNAFMKSNTGT